MTSPRRAEKRTLSVVVTVSRSRCETPGSKCRFLAFDGRCALFDTVLVEDADGYAMRGLACRRAELLD